MNRQITGTITLLITLASMQPAAGQYARAPLPGAGGSPALIAPLPPQMAGGSYAPVASYTSQPGHVGGPGYAMPNPGVPIPGPGVSYAVPAMMPPSRPNMGGGPGYAMPNPGVPMPGAGVSYAVPAMSPPPMQGQRMSFPVQPATYGGPGPQGVGLASCDGCDAGCDGCDSYGGGCCDGGGGLLGRFHCMCRNAIGNVGCGAGCGLKDKMAHDLHKHGPYGSGGCCKPRWFDAQGEWLYWKRRFDQSQPLSFQGIAGQTLALDTSQLSFDYESGFRVTAAYLVGPGTGLEATYFDGFSWVDSAVATGNQDLFSIFDLSPGGPFAETAFGFLHTVALSSEMNSGELNLRRRFVSAGCCVHSSLLVGVRYFRMRDDLIYETFTNDGSMSYQLKTGNDMVGSQIGGDLALCLTPRFKIGADVKAGVYGAHSTARTNVYCTSCEPVRELESSSDVAFLGEGGAFAIYKISPRWTFRGGYQVLYADRIATAVDNFNSASPLTARTTFIDNRGNAFIHGSNLGFEFTY